MNQRQLAKFQKALAEAAQVFTDIDTSTISLPIEKESDIVREAASVIAYFDSRDKFREEICRNCNRTFAYSYYITAVKCCSIPCMSAVLQTMGLTWDPTAPLDRRWGRYVPAIVPSAPYEIIQQTAPLPNAKTEGPTDDVLKNLINLL